MPKNRQAPARCPVVTSFHCNVRSTPRACASSDFDVVGQNRTQRYFHDRLLSKLFSMIGPGAGLAIGQVGCHRPNDDRAGHKSGNALARSQACLEMLSLEVEDRPEALEYIDRI